MTTTSEKMTTEEMEALSQKLATFNLAEACALLNSIEENEDAKELVHFIITHLNKQVASAVIQISVHNLLKHLLEQGLLNVTYDDKGNATVYSPALDSNGNPIPYPRNEANTHE